jgi:hypothetical protein
MGDNGAGQQSIGQLPSQSAPNHPQESGREDRQSDRRASQLGGSALAVPTAPRNVGDTPDEQNGSAPVGRAPCTYLMKTGSYNYENVRATI